MIYNELVRDCFFEPRHVGRIALESPLVAHFRCEQTKQAALIELYMQCNAQGLIERMCFKTNGNPYVIAALEWLCRENQGKMFEVLEPLNYQDLVQLLELPMNQVPVALQIQDVYKAVIELMAQKLGSKE